jgi:glucosyl-dolichyl phosphate glucuronosyltransferase
MDLPTCSIVICTFNNAHRLRWVLESIESQRVSLEVRWEVLVVDNNSDDETPMVVERFCQRGGIPRLWCVRERQQGLTFARRRGVRETGGELVALVDDDCILAEDWVENVVRSFQAHRSAGAIGGKVELEWECPPSALALEFQRSLAFQDRGSVAIQLPQKGWTYLVGAGLVFRRRALEASGWLEKPILRDRKGTRLSSGGDTEMVLRVRASGYELWYDPAIRLRHLVPAQRTSTEYLCRLHRGLGRSFQTLASVAESPRDTLKWRFGMLYSMSKECVPRLLKTAVRRAGCKPIDAKELIEFQLVLGKLEGAISVFFRPKDWRS